jgi:hypothetical protein
MLGPGIDYQLLYAHCSAHLFDVFIRLQCHKLTHDVAFLLMKNPMHSALHQIDEYSSKNSDTVGMGISGLNNCRLNASISLW